MGLYIHSLSNIPETANRDYFIYLLDYGWDEPIRNALRENFDKMAQTSAVNRAVVIRGTELGHFESEVFSWHKINGCDADDVLPALLITNKHPKQFQDRFLPSVTKDDLYQSHDDLKLILIPFKKFCKTTTEAVSLIRPDAKVGGFFAHGGRLTWRKGQKPLMRLTRPATRENLAA